MQKTVSLKVIEDVLDRKLNQRFKPVQSSIKDLDDKLTKKIDSVQANFNNKIATVQADLTQRIDTVQADVKTLKKDTAKIRKDIDVMLSFFDREYIDLRKRVERIEKHLGLPPLQ